MLPEIAALDDRYDAEKPTSSRAEILQEQLPKI